MSSLNSVQLIGRLGKDPEIRNFQNGGKIATFSIATSEQWKDKQTGEKKERTEWHNVSVNVDGLVGVVERFLKKGSQVYVQGQLQTRKWQDQSGNDRYTTEVVLRPFNSQLILLGSKGDGEGAAQREDSRSNGNSYQNGRGGTGGGASGQQGGYQRNDLDDEIPF